MEMPVEEFFSYTYLPIKLPDGQITVEPRLRVFNAIIGRAACDFIGAYGLDRYTNSYIYMTAKHLWQIEGFNRKGWHSDGFGTDDISYIWYDKQPTIFNNTDFFLSNDDSLSMVEMEEQARPEFDYHYPNNSLIRMDQYSIHRVGDIESGPRCFVKICISKDIYNLKGNAINYDLDYQWEYRERKWDRNVPQNV